MQTDYFPYIPAMFLVSQVQKLTDRVASLNRTSFQSAYEHESETTNQPILCLVTESAILTHSIVT